jgi:hypothetical protein
MLRSYLLSIFALLTFKKKNNVNTNVNGKVVLIAGGGKNLGGLLSRGFAAKGASWLYTIVKAQEQK